MLPLALPLLMNFSVDAWMIWDQFIFVWLCVSNISISVLLNVRLSLLLKIFLERISWFLVACFLPFLVAKNMTARSWSIKHHIRTRTMGTKRMVCITDTDNKGRATCTKTAYNKCSKSWTWIWVQRVQRAGHENQKKTSNSQDDRSTRQYQDREWSITSYLVKQNNYLEH